MDYIPYFTAVGTVRKSAERGITNRTAHLALCS
jgi:hypothetical protein